MTCLHYLTDGSAIIVYSNRRFRQETKEEFEERRSKDIKEINKNFKEISKEIIFYFNNCCTP
jgi:hypothetical protein